MGGGLAAEAAGRHAESIKVTPVSTFAFYSQMLCWPHDGNWGQSLSGPGFENLNQL